MENAVKALMMAAGVLIGIMILFLGITLFSSMGEYMGTTQEQIDENAVQDFNDKFTRYINCSNDTGVPEFTLTIQDVVSAANTAYESNTNYGLTAPADDNYYVSVKLSGESLEQIINGNSATILTNNMEKRYICKSNDVKINANTNRVYEVNFWVITDDGE